MKEKEMLAKRYSEAVDDGWSAKKESAIAWIAGFETAKEMLEKQVRQEDYSVHVLDILHLGEKEV